MSDPIMEQAERETNAWDVRALVTIVVIVFLVFVVVVPCVYLYNLTITPQIRDTLATLEALK